MIADEPAEASHFMKHAIERKKEKIIFDWLRGHLGRAPLTLHELEKQFAIDFFEQAPKIFMLADVGFQPESALELHQYLDRFEKRRKILIDDGRYRLLSR